MPGERARVGMMGVPRGIAGEAKRRYNDTVHGGRRVVFCACRIRIPCINRTSIYQCIAFLTKLLEQSGQSVEEVCLIESGLSWSCPNKSAPRLIATRHGVASHGLLYNRQARIYRRPNFFKVGCSMLATWLATSTACFEAQEHRREADTGINPSGSQTWQQRKSGIRVLPHH